MAHRLSYDHHYTGRVSVKRVRLNAGGYTSAGRYFGVGAPLFEITTNGGETDGVWDFMRGRDRATVISKVRGLLPNARFSGAGVRGKPPGTRRSRRGS